MSTKTKESLLFFILSNVSTFRFAQGTHVRSSLALSKKELTKTTSFLIMNHHVYRSHGVAFHLLLHMHPVPLNGLQHLSCSCVDLSHNFVLLFATKLRKSHILITQKRKMITFFVEISFHKLQKSSIFASV